VIETLRVDDRARVLVDTVPLHSMEVICVRTRGAWEWSATSSMGSVLHQASIDLTDDCAGPRCARVHPPALEWSTGGV
jgi:hypothetical protein